LTTVTFVVSFMTNVTTLFREPNHACREHHEHPWRQRGRQDGPDLSHDPHGAQPPRGQPTEGKYALITSGSSIDSTRESPTFASSSSSVFKEVLRVRKKTLSAYRRESFYIDNGECRRRIYMCSRYRSRSVGTERSPSALLQLMPASPG
jgi:hypothetical protein